MSNGRFFFLGWAFFVGCVLVLNLPALPAAELVLGFAADDLGRLPPGFRSAVTGEGEPGQWEVVLSEAPLTLAVHSDQSPVAARFPALAQLATDPTDEHFPLLIYDRETFGDFTLTTRFKLVGGVREQMAGLAFRLQDENNYYIARISGLGSNFMFYKFVDGVRSPPVGVPVNIAKDAWHELSVICEGNTMQFLLDGRQIMPKATDYSFTSGKIGLWTKSDSVAHFGETRIRYTPHEYLAQVLVADTLRKYNKLTELKIYARASTNAQVVQVIASHAPTDMGLPAGQVEVDVLRRNVTYAGKTNRHYIVTLPLHDRNGDPIAAVRIVTKAWILQTEANAVARALPIVREMEKRIRSETDLYQ